MFEMKAAVTIPKEVFVRAGYSANAEIVLNKVDSVNTVPENCIEFNNDTAFVYVLKTEEPQTFEKKKVETGMSDGMKIEIKSGLNAKDKIRGSELMDTKNLVVNKD
jgi:HlyD family secretion protein